MHKWILALVAALSVGAALATPATVVMLDAENMTCPACGRARPTRSTKISCSTCWASGS